MVLIHVVDQAACQWVHQLSRDRRNLILCILPPDQARTNLWSLLDAGAKDIVYWRDQQAVLDQFIARLRRWHTITQTIATQIIADNLIGSDPHWLEALQETVEAAMFSHAPVMILGESGTGKEQIAKTIHALDPVRQDNKFVLIDCTTIVPELSGSEFFGHERGAFTGASSCREGAFSIADGGTLFIDEIGELPLILQAQLLRVIQEGTFKRVGGNKWLATDFRAICATNRDLAAEVKAGRFRHDLYYRLAGCNIKLPTLNDRSADILPLARHFLSDALRLEHQLTLDQALIDFLLSRHYAGNVRDLKLLCEQIAVRYTNEGPLTIGCIPRSARPSGSTIVDEPPCDQFHMGIEYAVLHGAGLKNIGQQAKEAAIRIAAVQTDDNLHDMAKLLDVTVRTLQMHRKSSKEQH